MKWVVFVVCCLKLVNAAYPAPRQPVYFDDDVERWLGVQMHDLQIKLAEASLEIATLAAENAALRADINSAGQQCEAKVAASLQPFRSLIKQLEDDLQSKERRLDEAINEIESLKQQSSSPIIAYPLEDKQPSQASAVSVSPTGNQSTGSDAPLLGGLQASIGNLAGNVNLAASLFASLLERGRLGISENAELQQTFEQANAQLAEANELVEHMKEELAPFVEARA